MVSGVCRQVARELACVEVVQTTTHRLPLALWRLTNNKCSREGAENPADKCSLDRHGFPCWSRLVCVG